MSFQSIIDLKTALRVETLIEDARRASDAAPRRVCVLEIGPGYTRRQITLAAGEELPFRRNEDLEKIWRVRSGLGHADIAETEITLMPGAEVNIARGHLHQIENRGAEPLVLEETRKTVAPG